MSTDHNSDGMAFRRALGNFATGITVVTARAPDGSRVGVTANSFNSVSLDPPLILWSIDKRSASFEVFSAASHFAVNVLAADQVSLSNHFARPAPDKFAHVAFEQGLGGAAILPDCSAVFECERHACVDGGDHWILLGRVERFTDAGRPPLLYHQGSYSLVMPMGESAGSGSTGDGGKASAAATGDNLYFLMLQALKHYEADYRPKQLATGLRTAEARMLLSLKASGNLDRDTLSAQVNMPREDMQQAFLDLIERGLIQERVDQFELTPSGHKSADALWQIAKDEQERKFASFSADDISVFKRMLLQLTNTDQ